MILATFISVVWLETLFDFSINDSLRRMTMNANWISLHCISILLPFKHNFGRSSGISPLFHNSWKNIALATLESRWVFKTLPKLRRGLWWKKINGLKSLFSQNTPSSMFDKILDNPLENVLLGNQLYIFKTFPPIVVKNWYYFDQKMSPANINSHCHVIDILSK